MIRYPIRLLRVVLSVGMLVSITRNPTVEVVRMLPYVTVRHIFLCHYQVFSISTYIADFSSGQSTLVATQSEAVLEQHDNVNILFYKHDNMLVNVYLTCISDGPESINAREDSTTIVNIYLQSPCCCPGKCHYSEESSVTGGAVFLILLVALAFVYIVGGMIFLKFSRGASGSDMIPNRLLWLNILSYIRDGIRYSIQVVRHRTLSVEYQKV